MALGSCLMHPPLYLRKLNVRDWRTESRLSSQGLNLEMNPEPTPTLGATGGDTAWEPLNYWPMAAQDQCGEHSSCQRISSTGITCHWLCLRWTMTSLQDLGAKMTTCDRTGTSMLVASWKGRPAFRVGLTAWHSRWSWDSVTNASRL